MPIHEAFVTHLSQCTPAAFQEVGLYLFTNNAKALSFPTQCNLHLHEYSISCLSDGNSKIYKVTNRDQSEACILKLERWSMPQEIQDKFKKNPVLKNALAKVYFNKSCTIEYKIEDKKYREKMNIQIQPFCKGGTLESAADKKMTDEERLDSALKLYTKVAKFYIALQEENILFPDGKPSNFTLDANGNLQLTDMKTYVASSTEELKSCAQINTQSYPLYIPIPPPRQRDAVHARHFGMNLYAYLTGRTWNDFYVPDIQEWIPLPTAAYTYNNPIFESVEGGIVARLIQNMIANDPAKQPSVEDAQKILNLVGNVRAVRSQNKDDADAKIIATYHEFFVKHPTLLRLINATMVKDWVTNAVVNPDDAVNAFPTNQEIIQAALHQHLLVLKAIISWYPTDKALIRYEKQIGTELKDFNQLSRIMKILQSTEYKKIIAEIKQLRQKGTFVTTNPFTWFQRGDDMLNRANRIEQALYQLPLEERGNMSIDKLLSISAESDNTLQQKTAQYQAGIHGQRK